MAGKLFDKLEREAFRGGIQARTKESMRWFRTRVSQIKNVNRTEPVSYTHLTLPTNREV